MKNKLTALIIDDHQLIREAWKILLSEQERYQQVLDASSGERALDLVRDHRPDLVILDINMSPLNGFEILASIQVISPSTKVIAVSMHAAPAYARKMLQGGALGYVTKNSNSEEMLHAIDEVLAGNKFVCDEVKTLLSAELFNSPRETVANVLTDRENEVIACIREGNSSKEIAVRLFISIKTVEAHRHNILKKLGVKNLAGLMRLLKTNAM